MSNTTTIIGLMGPAGSGKSTVAARLVEKYGAVEYSFADPLKELAMRTLGFTREQCYGTQAQKETDDPRYGFSPRWFLQRLGTEGMRHVFGEDVWWRVTLDRIHKEAPRLAVISDVRFWNEANALHRERAILWRLDRPERATKADPTHQSEAEYLRCHFDHRIEPVNEGLPWLYMLVDQAADMFNILPVERAS